MLKRSLRENIKAHAQFFSALLCMCPAIPQCYILSFNLNLAAAEYNTTEYIGDQRIYGLFTDMNHFVFYSFDPVTKRFAFDSQFSLKGGLRGQLMSMIPGERSPYPLVRIIYLHKPQSRGQGIQHPTRWAHSIFESSSCIGGFLG
jgi:hypothetical protein